MGDRLSSTKRYEADRIGERLASRGLRRARSERARQLAGPKGVGIAARRCDRPSAVECPVASANVADSIEASAVHERHRLPRPDRSRSRELRGCVAGAGIARRRHGRRASCRSRVARRLPARHRAAAFCRDRLEAVEEQVKVLEDGRAQALAVRMKSQATEILRWTPLDSRHGASRCLPVESALAPGSAPMRPSGLGDAMRYAVLDGGKRLRPLLVPRRRRSGRGDARAPPCAPPAPSN